MSTAQVQPGGFMAFIQATPGAKQLPEVCPAIAAPLKGTPWLDAVNASQTVQLTRPEPTPLVPGVVGALDAWQRAIAPAKA